MTNLLQKILITVVLLSLATYCTISIVLMAPYLVGFINGKYLVQIQDLPTYRDVFNSLFIVLNIIVTTLLSYMIYRLSVGQERRELRACANYVYYELKFQILVSFCELLNNSKGKLIPEEYDTHKGPSSAMDYIENHFGKEYQTYDLHELKMSAMKMMDNVAPRKMNYLKQNIKKGVSKDFKFNALIMDIINFKGQSNQALCYVFRNEIVKVIKVENDLKLELVQYSTKELVYILDAIMHDKWDCLTEDYKFIMKHLHKLT